MSTRKTQHTGRPAASLRTVREDVVQLAQARRDLATALLALADRDADVGRAEVLRRIALDEAQLADSLDAFARSTTPHLNAWLQIPQGRPVAIAPCEPSLPAILRWAAEYDEDVVRRWKTLDRPLTPRAIRELARQMVDMHHRRARARAYAARRLS